MNKEKIEGKIKQFDPAQMMRGPFTCIISASRNSGKSNLLKHFWQDYFVRCRYFHTVAVFSKTLETDFYTFLPGELQFNTLNMTALGKIIASCKRATALGKCYRVLIILDDCISARDKYNEMLTYIFTAGRHVNISLVYISQKLSYCANTWYNNANYIMFLRNKSRSEKKYIVEKCLYDVFGDAFPEGVSETNIKTWCTRFLGRNTRDYRAIVVCPLNEAPTKVSDNEVFQYNIFFYKAPLK